MSLDDCGHVFFANFRLVNRDSARTHWHDAVLHTFDRFLHEAGIMHKTEVYALFTKYASSAVTPPSARERSHIVPDLAIEELDGTHSHQGLHLFEVKTLYFSPKW